MAETIKETIKVKNKLYINRNKGDKKEARLRWYKEYRNQLNHILRMTERKYYQDLLPKHKSNVKKSINTKFKCNDKITEDGHVIFNKFNNFFVNVATTLAKNIPLSNKSPTEYMISNTTDLFILDPVLENEVLKIISNIKDSSAGWDELKPLTMKNIKECIKT